MLKVVSLVKYVKEFYVSYSRLKNSVSGFEKCGFFSKFARFIQL